MGTFRLAGQYEPQHFSVALDPGRSLVAGALPDEDKPHLAVYDGTALDILAEFVGPQEPGELLVSLQRMEKAIRAKAMLEAIAVVRDHPQQGTETALNELLTRYKKYASR
ncbi:hypothetical protein [Microbacterium sp. LWH11-1.2]|uniref:hypothetical protein n=1 Tax=Microbacterium sp. LWH11-1.2 TaxID=3135258 RepID=UPI003138F7EF